MPIDTAGRALAKQFAKRGLQKGVSEVTQEGWQQGGKRAFDTLLDSYGPGAREAVEQTLDQVDIRKMRDVSEYSSDTVRPILDSIRVNDNHGLGVGLKTLDDTVRRTDAEAKFATSGKQDINPTVPPQPQNNFTVSKENLAPGIEGIDLEPQKAAAMEYHSKTQAIQGDRGEGGLSIASSVGQLKGQQKGFNLSAKEKAETIKRAYVEGEGLGTKVEEVKGPSGRTRTNILADIERMPYRELHHIFGKAMGAKIIDNVWRLIELEKASVEDLINLNHWAQYYGMGLGDFGTEAVNRVPHSDTHAFSRNYGIEMSSADIEAMPVFDDMDELTSYFRELLETRVKPMRAELDLQQGAYDLLPDQMRLAVEQLKVAKEDASRELTQSYKDIYKKKMKDTPDSVKDTYQTHKWIQEELGVTEPDLIEKARKLDQARYTQDQQMNRVKELKGSNIEDAIRSAQGKQIALEEQSEFLPPATTRRGYGEEYAANRIDPETTVERQMLEAGEPTSEAEMLANIERIRSGEKPTDILYQDTKGKYKKRKTAKKQPKSKK